MVIEADWRLLASAGLLRGFPQRMQAGFRGAVGGQQSQNAAQNQNPDAETEFVLKPYTHQQKKHCGKDNGQAKLADPHQQTQNFHETS